jgi:DNA-binding CsgD family transcriptional regulator
VPSATRSTQDRKQPLVGRARELRRLLDFLTGASAQDGGALLVLGEPGVGKSALLAAAAEHVVTCGGHVLQAAGLEHEVDMTYASLSLLLAPLLDRLVEVAPRDRRALSIVLGLADGPAPSRLSVMSAVLALLAVGARSRPLLLVVDDLPWVDRSSAVVLGLVARRLSRTRVALLVASRTGETSFFESIGLPELRLEPLDAAGSLTLVQTEFPRLAARVRQRVLVEAEGNPLALLELPAAMSSTERESTHPVSTALPLGHKLQTTFAGRLVGLPPATRSLLLLAALDATGDLGRLGQRGEEGAQLDVLEPAELVNLVRVDDAGVRVVFRHPLVRAAVVAASTGAERRRAHLALAAQLDDQPERRVWHLAAACVGPDQDVSGLLESIAGDVLGRGDPVGAVTALIRAADLAVGGAQRSRLLAQAAYIGGGVTGDLRDVSRLLADARRADPGHDESLYAAVAAAYALLNGDGDLRTAHRLLVGALQSGVSSGRQNLRVGSTSAAADAAVLAALHGLLTLCSWGEQSALWPPLFAAIEAHRGSLPAGLDLRVQVLGDPAHLEASTLTAFDAAVATLHEQSDSAKILQIAIAGTYIDRVGSCRPALWRVVEEGRDGGAVTSVITALATLCAEDVAAGEWDEVLALADEGLRLCETYGYGLPTWIFHRGRAMVAAGRGEQETVQRLTEGMAAWAAPRGVGMVQMFGRHARGLAALGRGDFEAAFAELAAVSPPGQLPAFSAYTLKLPLDLVEAAVRTNRRSVAEAHVAAMQQARLPLISPHLAVLTAGAAALCASGEQASALYEQALAVPGAQRWPFDLARVRLAYGEHLRRDRSMVAARTQLSAAVEVFERLGARPWVDRGVAELRATGQTRHREDHAELGLLTPQEREIALLAASGLSNKQIGERLYLSHRTVGTHLYRAFPKLGVSSRAALRDALADSAPG